MFYSEEILKNQGKLFIINIKTWLVSYHMSIFIVIRVPAILNYVGFTVGNNMLTIIDRYLI